MTAPILLTGGTGTLGRLVAPLLVDAGREVRVLSRSSHADGGGVQYVLGDLETGAGVAEAVTGVRTVVHCAGSAKGDEQKARHLVEAAAAAGVQHIVNISVVGADRIPVVSGVDRAMFGYFASKRAAELAIEDSGIAWTTLRATQFHELMFMVVAKMAKLPVIPAPRGISFQPVAAAEVASRLVDAALAPPAGLLPDIAGPHVYELKELVRSYLRSRSRSRPIIRVGTPGGAARALRAGANLSTEQATGRQTWEEFLGEPISASSYA